MFTIETAADAVELVMLIAFLIMGTSHIVQPAMWRKFFIYLHDLGTTGVIIRTFALELWPALAVVSLHQIWSGPGVVLTLYGWALAIKCTISLLAPQIGLRSLKMADGSERRFIGAGIALLAIGASLVWSLAT